MKRLAFLFVLLAFCVPARAADSTVSSLTAAGALGSTDLFYCTQTGADRKCTSAQIATFMNSLISGDCTIAANVITCTKTNTVAFGTFATANSATPPAIGNTTPAAGSFTTLSASSSLTTNVTGSTQCVQVNSSGVVAGSATPCFKPVQYYVSGLTYAPVGSATSLTAGIAPGANVIKCFPGAITLKLTVDALAVALTTGSAGTNGQFAIYNSASGRPGTLIVATGSQDLTNTGNLTPALTASKQLGPGGTDGDQNLWFCSNLDSGVPVFTSVTVNPQQAQSLMGTSTIANLFSLTADVGAVSCAGAACNGGSSTFGTWPNLTGSTWTDVTTRTMPMIAFHVSSIP